MRPGSPPRSSDGASTGIFFRSRAFSYRLLRIRSHKSVPCARRHRLHSRHRAPDLRRPRAADLAPPRSDPFALRLLCSAPELADAPALHELASARAHGSLAPHETVSRSANTAPRALDTRGGARLRTS